MPQEGAESVARQGADDVVAAGPAATGGGRAADKKLYVLCHIDKSAALAALGDIAARFKGTQAGKWASNTMAEPSWQKWKGKDMRSCARMMAKCAAMAFLSVSLGIAADAPPLRPASGPVTGPALLIQSGWERDLAVNYEAVRLLYRSEPGGSNVSEVFQWRAKALKDNPQRFQDLQEIVKEHPDSPFADDAALLLARAQFLYKGDAAGAIDGLYEVSKKYPDGVWFAGDPMVLGALVPLVGRLKPYLDGEGNPHIKVLEDSKRAEKNIGESRSELSKVQEYLDYQDGRPNKTSDEAKYWIAWIIMQAKLEDRYPEAERLLGEVGQKYKDTNRTKEDVAAAVKMGNSLVGKLPRVERSASAMLVELLEKTGRKAEALAEVQRHLLVYEGSPSTDWAKKKAEQLGQK